MRDNQEFVKVAARLARSAPVQWQEFLAQLRVRDSSIKNSIVSSPIDDLLVLKGRAQEMASLLKDLEECIRIADQMEKK